VIVQVRFRLWRIRGNGAILGMVRCGGRGMSNGWHDVGGPSKDDVMLVPDELKLAEAIGLS
jgi:hypothetical protein